MPKGYTGYRRGARKVGAVGLYSDRMTTAYPTFPAVWRESHRSDVAVRETLRPFDREAVMMYTYPLYVPETGRLLPFEDRGIRDLHFAGGFSSRMALYSKATVDKVFVTVKIVTVPNAQGGVAPIHGVAGMALTTDQVTQDLAGLKMFLNQPKTQTLVDTGSHTMKKTFAIDLTKSVSRDVRQRTMITSNRAGNIYIPNDGPAARIDFPFPVFLVLLRNLAQEDTAYLLDVTIDYHLTYSAPHILTLDVGPRAAPDFLRDPRQIEQEQEDLEEKGWVSPQVGPNKAAEVRQSMMNIEPRGSPNKFKR